jgi:RNA polymerase sigma-70 factor (ECF subfamily)
MGDSKAADREAALNAWAAGRPDALNALVPALYRELRALAHRYIRRERAGHTLQTTSLVHEAYLRLVGQRSVPWQNRDQFLGLAAHMMRRILVNYAVARRREKRGGAEPALSIDEVPEVAAAPDLHVIALHEALEALERVDPRQAKIVELRYFAGLGVEETARVIGVSPATIHREWATARQWLYRALSAGERRVP